jgi:Trk K+ transport system NAD-binding subunit
MMRVPIPAEWLKKHNEHLSRVEPGFKPYKDWADYMRRESRHATRSPRNAPYEEVLKKEMDIGLETTLTTVSHGRALSLGEGITLAEMDVPGVLVGRSIRDFGARHAPDLQIVLIRKERDKEGAQVREAIMPSASYVFERGDVLVVMGKEKDVKRLREG